MKQSFSLLLLMILSHAVISQNCNLTEDRKDGYGNILRGTEWSYTDASGNYMHLQLDRTKDRYTFVVSLDQPTSSAVRFKIDGEIHPIIFNLSNGATAKAWVSESRVYESENGTDRVAFAEQYTFDASGLANFDNARVTAIVFRCSGRSLSTGNAVNEIRIVPDLEAGESLSNAMSCLQKEDEAVALKPAPKPRKESHAITTSTSGSATSDALMRELIQVVGEGTKNIDESVKESGTTQMEQNMLMMEKLENLSAAIEKLNETKKEEKEFVPRVFGFGAYFKTNFLFSEIDMNYGLAEAQVSKFLSGTSINMSLNAGMRARVGFRFEITADFLTSFNEVVKYTDSIYPRTVTPDTIYFGQPYLETFERSQTWSFYDVGLNPLLVIRRGKVNIYLGLSASYIRIEGKYKDSSPSQLQDRKETGQITAFRQGVSLGFILGGEYLITPHFGVRVESGLRYFGIGKTVISSNDLFEYDDDSSVGDNRQNVFGSFARIGGSFYF